ncbi:hypothetical protein AOL_s00007g293 [Orbilia oligospora ATCC 24927]|uniref:Major facilitator superfamily (MFS) profile domain-containing protein n=1 Tax=Arthrobotrys oligospora (strain ATCC 24927 / CBS 115.81 / DSM 1491) TaxID=756982 RepID=G1X1Y4_ARTOA|nr:hypothetical protein AOL_s00007g293 [Orbilia oligospora ATCC 24927]EGX52957.1 hypothetical protein AOL_s00007g293 [Orbilia oligospora ATCC 24927]
MIQPQRSLDPELSEHQPLIRGDGFNPDEIVYHSTPEPQSIVTKNQQDELPRVVEDDEDDEGPVREVPSGFWGVVACLLIGVIVANIDTSLVMATFGQIGSEFGRLDDANWMIVGYQLGVLTTQPMVSTAVYIGAVPQAGPPHYRQIANKLRDQYGKLSDIFGRKALLLISYGLFAVGCLWIGTSTEFWHLVVGRVISGIGGGGMTSVVSILLNDLVPLRDLAAWRSYVYIAATLGRSCGAPLGGFMVDTIGWRWYNPLNRLKGVKGTKLIIRSFLGQVPLAVLAIAMVSIKLNIPHKGKQRKTENFFQCFRRIDFTGALSLAASLSLFLVFLDEAGKRMFLANKLLIGSGIGSLIFGAIFFYVEAYVAKEPILSLRILTQRDVLSVYSTLGLTTGSQISFVSTVAIYFVITLGVSNADAAARIVFGNVAHAMGGLMAGILIRRTGRYKRYLVIAMSISTIALLLVTIRWRGNTNIFETAYIAPAGFGIGMINTAAFIALSASVEHKDQAMATSGFYLSDNLGFVAISSLGNAVLQTALAKRLDVRLDGVTNKKEASSSGYLELCVIRDVMASIRNIKGLDQPIREKAIKAFVEALQWDHG